MMDDIIRRVLLLFSPVVLRFLLLILVLLHRTTFPGKLALFISTAMITTLEEIIACPEFQKLDGIGGHKTYHLEGSALTHTMMVIAEAKKMFPDEPLMWRVAALHDIGKIYCSIENGPDDWSYPDHSIVGSLKGILCKFISLQDENFDQIQWYIRNHIKPMHWMYDGDKVMRDIAEMKVNMPTRCSIDNLIKFVICDIRGSKSIVEQTSTIEYLEGIISQRDLRKNLVNQLESLLYETMGDGMDCIRCDEDYSEDYAKRCDELAKILNKYNITLK